MIQCRTKGTKIPYGNVTVAANDGLPEGTKITQKNIKQMRIKIKADPLLASAPPAQQPSVAKPKVKTKP